MKVVEEFKEFIKEYKIVGLAVAFIMGLATNDLVKSLVNDIIMPLINPLISSGEWQTVTFELGPAVLGVGQFLAALLNFIILAFLVFFVVEKVIKADKKEKKK
jgi:large conductance mechanosensitive channel